MLVAAVAVAVGVLDSPAPAVLEKKQTVLALVAQGALLSFVQPVIAIEALATSAVTWAVIKLP